MLILQGVQIMGRNEVIRVADMRVFRYLFRFEVVQCSDLRSHIALIIMYMINLNDVLL